MQKYYNSSWQDVVDRLQSNIYKGLTLEECQHRRKEYGSNKIKLPKNEGRTKSIFLAIINLYFIIILFIGLFCTYKKHYFLGRIIFINLFINIILKIAYLRKKGRQLAELQRINNTTVKVIRSSKEIVIKSEELVIGDIVIFQKGSLIAADLRIIEGKDLRVNEENITGEKFAKEKFANKIEGEINNIGEVSNILYKGSLVKEGTGLGIVVKIGKDTYFGEILRMLLHANSTKHTLQKVLQRKIEIASIVGILISVVFFGIFRDNSEALKAMIYSLFVIAVMPYWLFSIIYLKYINWVEGKSNNEIINYSSLYDFDNIDILFMDKIEGVTKKEAVIKEIYTDNNIFNIEDIRYDKNINFKRIIDGALLCNDSTYNVGEDKGKGNIYEIAYLRYAANNGILKSALDVKNRRVFQIPRASEKKFKTTLNKSRKGCRANLRGNVDSILEKCTNIMIDGREKEIEIKDIERIKAIDYNLSLKGYITEGIAYRSFGYQPTLSENIESNLVFVGIVALENPLQENIEEKITYLKNNKIIPFIFTEDNKIAASALGRKIGIIQRDNQVVSGVEVESLSKEEFIEVLKNA